MDFTLVYMIAYIPTGITIGTSQRKLPLFLREKLRHFWSIWQESYSDDTKENRRNTLVGVEATKRRIVARRTHLDNEKQTPVLDRGVNVLYPKGNETAKCASHGSESEPVGKAQAELVLRIEQCCNHGRQGINRCV